MAKPNEPEVIYTEGKIDPVEVNSIVERNFIDYSMSVIVSRAIPDVRDGLKPVHRRILWAMYDLGMTPDKPFKKSARIVGEVIGKYHPHGDSAVYESMVRMAQQWNMRNTLVLGHGNFGSMDGDSAAAMRYTEAKLDPMAIELLRDIEKNTVDFKENFDGEEKEPSVLPARFPNMLVNGSEGIAVGMATKMAPHNLKEVIQAIIAYMDDETITIENIMQYIKGPDFPTGAMIMGEEGIEKAYTTGRGSVVVRGVVEVVEKAGKTFIHIKQLPYQVNKLKLKQQIEEQQVLYDQSSKEKDKKGAKKTIGLDFMVKDGVTDGTGRASSVNDILIRVELKKGVDPRRVINHLYKHTSLQSSFSMLNLALVPKIDHRGREVLKPELLNLKSLISEYVKHQIKVERRKQEHELLEKQTEMHLLHALIQALDKLDDTIDTIRAAKSRTEAVEGLMALLLVDEVQAKHILDRRLQTLANFEIDEQRKKHVKLGDEIREIEEIIADDKKITTIIKKSLEDISVKYGEDRRTEIMPPAEEINMEDLIVDEEVVVTISHTGYIKRTPQNSYRSQRRNGRGVNGMNTNEEDFVEHLEVAKNHDTLLIFTNNGRVYRIRVFEIPEYARTAKGTSIYNLLSIEKNEKIQAVLSIRDFSEQQNVIFATKNGTVKKTKLSEYANIRQNGIAAITLREEKGVTDSVVGVELTNGEQNITLVTKHGMSITFDEREVKSVSRAGIGVKGITLDKGDEVVSFDKHEAFADLFIATNTGYGKRTPLEEFRVQTRGGKGVIVCKLTEKNGEVVGARVVQEQDALMLITKNGTLIKLLVDSISKFGRNTQGTKIMNLREKDEIQGIARIADGAEDDHESEEDEE